MALPAFFSRVADSLRPVAEIDPDALRQKLDQLTIRIELRAADPNALAAFELAANLCARLYPRLELDAPDALAKKAEEVVRAINPVVDVNRTDRNDHRQPPNGSKNERVEATLVIGAPTTGDALEDSVIYVSAHGWDLAVDTPADEISNAGSPAALGGQTLTWLAGAAIGVAEVFRWVFSEELGDRGRTASQPGGFNLITGSPAESATHEDRATPPLAVELTQAPIDLGQVHLIGAGAIGQAFVYALAAIDAVGTLHVIDPETVTLSNLQRYLLTDANSVDRIKAELASEALRVGDLKVRPYSGRWGDLPAHLGVDTVAVGLDTAQDRIAVAATLPRRAYNAWTQTADLGWSRHEAFGVAPCLACLYYPDKVRPSDHELIAEALGQAPLRVLAYLSENLPIGTPLKFLPQLAELQPSPGDERWLQVSLAADLVAAGMMNEAELEAWNGRSIGTLYRDGICAGGLIPTGTLSNDVLVPLAHQSALAGIMLAVELVTAQDPRLKLERSNAIERRYDVLRGFPQIVSRPREKTPHCFCSDPDFVETYSARI